MAMPFVELHFHLLPAVDDGPRTTEESLALAVAATADGTRTVAGIRDPSRLAETIPRALLDHGLVIRESAVAA